jgi:hypothetical protein
MTNGDIAVRRELSRKKHNGSLFHGVGIRRRALLVFANLFLKELRRSETSGRARS